MTKVLLLSVEITVKQDILEDYFIDHSIEEVSQRNVNQIIYILVVNMTLMSDLFRKILEGVEGDRCINAGKSFINSMLRSDQEGTERIHKREEAI